ncbi:MAG: hypothetical protein ACRDUB_00710, partial [Mycobacterium sp.]
PAPSLQSHPLDRRGANQCWPCPEPEPDGTCVVVTTDLSRVGSCWASLVVGATVACTGGFVGAGVVTEGTVTVGATVVTVCAGAGLWVGDGATVADAVGGLVTTGSVEGTVADWVAVAVAVGGTVDGAEVAVDAEDDDVDVAVGLLDAVDDGELVVSVGDVVLVDEDVVVVSDGDVDALVDVEDVSVDVAVVDDEVVVDVLDVALDDDVGSTTGTGNRVSGEDGRTGCGSPGGGSVAAGFCSTTL